MIQWSNDPIIQWWNDLMIPKKEWLKWSLTLFHQVSQIWNCNLQLLTILFTKNSFMKTEEIKATIFSFKKVPATYQVHWNLMTKSSVSKVYKYFTIKVEVFTFPRASLLKTNLAVQLTWPCVSYFPHSLMSNGTHGPC